MKIMSSIFAILLLLSATANIFSDQEMFTGFDQAGFDFIEGMENLTTQFMSSTTDQQEKGIACEGEQVSQQNNQSDAVTVIPATSTPQKMWIENNASSFEENDTDRDEKNNKPMHWLTKPLGFFIGAVMAVQTAIILTKMFSQTKKWATFPTSGQFIRPIKPQAKFIRPIKLSVTR